MQPVNNFEIESIKEDAHEEAYGDVAWLGILGDLMMLLLTFFVMLFSIAAPNADQYLEVLKNIGDALGGKSIVERKASPIDEARDKMHRIITDNNLVNDIELTSDTRGLVIYSRGDFFFTPGSADLLPDTVLFLKKVAAIIKTIPLKVLVEGHTDDVPIKTPRFPTNWELSTARAATVVRYFIEEENIDPKRFIVAGYGEFKPRFPLVPENRPKNRRVEIVILKGKAG
ncbi:MAG: chemotaxis protein MotB [bacterium]|nr:MAG: chemotaxis protein MotB [bacterium]